MNDLLGKINSAENGSFSFGSFDLWAILFFWDEDL
jgi:hypothetical protein